MPTVAGAQEVAAVVAEQVAATGFSGVVRVDHGGRTLLEVAHGAADRRHGIAMTPAHRLGTASLAKGLTALAVMSLVDEGVLRLGTTARSLLGDDLPLVADDVTVEHLLAHRSGIGDYLDEGDDEGDIGDYVMPVPVHRLADAEDYLAVLDGFPTVFAAGERFRYCNGGYVVLAILAQRAAGRPYHDLVAERVLGPAGMTATGFLRSDDLPGDAAVGYVEVAGAVRTYVLHLPVRGVGDGGAHTTAADLHRFWTRLLAGRVVPPAVVAEMLRPRSVADPEGGSLPPRRYGLGFWLHPSTDAVMLEGYDAGVSCVSVHVPSQGLTYSVLSNTSEGAWPVAGALRDLLAPWGAGA